MMHNSSFTVAGMSTSTSTHHSPNLNTWGSTSTGGQLSSSFSESLSQSRSHYQPGYLMSSQTTNAPQGNQRVDEVPIVQTKAKMNQILTRGSASDFGMDSMFESTRQRQKLADEDAPPTNSVEDIPNQFNRTPSTNYQPRNSTQDIPSFARHSLRRTPASPQPGQQPLYIIVFGYPADKYSVAVEYFQALGAATDPDPNLDIQNCFRIGFKDPGDALRAVRKHGEVLDGCWMVGAKWADPAQVEALLGQPPLALSESTSSASNAMSVDEPHSPASPQKGSAAAASSYKYGTPLKLAPSSAAFRRNDATPQQPPPTRGWGAIMPVSIDQQQQQAVQAQPPPSTGTPNKSMLGQMTDFIFGW